jgi:flagellar basal body-associated protein FliL
MSNLSNSKPENQSQIISNIRVIKIIAIILGLLIILGLSALIIGLSNSYNNLENSEQNKNNILNIDEQKLSILNFVQPFSSQLISSSLGQDNEILLRYLYKGNNILVMLNSKTKKIRSIITIKKGSQFGVN